MPVIDQHDDLCASFRQSGMAQSAAELLKTAQWKERDDLLDRDFAVILVDSEGKEHRKFACHDPGNTLMSQWYLMNVDHNLPPEAVKVASANLLNAAEDFGMGPHPALALLAAQDLDTPGDGRRLYVKTASSTQYSNPDVYEPSQVMRPMGRGMAEPTHRGQVKEASAFDAISETIRAWDEMDPYDKHEAAVDVVKLASAVGASVPSHIFQYSGTSLNPRFEKVASRRAQYTANEDYQKDYIRLSKMASAMDPDDVVEALFLMDERAGLLNKYGSALPNPVLAVFATEKQAEYSWNHGGDYVTETQLRRYSGSMASNAMEDVFTEDIRDRFRKDPVASFKSMPLEQQVLVARLASQSRDTDNGGY
jgi:hypothetical protein